MEIHKYHGGDIAHPEDPRVPQTPVEIYIRDSNDNTFYVESLAEGIAHLLSNEGYRLSITEFLDGKGFGSHNLGFGVIIRREGDNLEVSLRAPGVAPIGPPNKVILTQSQSPETISDTTVEDIEVDESMIRVVSLKPSGKESPIIKKPIWGDTDLPVYSLDEIKAALIRIEELNLDMSQLPSVLQEIREKNS
jgi:hypothetical protein